MASGTASAVAAPPAEPRPERGLTVAGASKHWGPVQALRDVSLDVDLGEVVGLVGENGAGKSTLVGVVSGTVRPDRGEVTSTASRAARRRPPARRARRVGRDAGTVARREPARVREPVPRRRSASPGPAPASAARAAGSGGASSRDARRRAAPGRRAHRRSRADARVGALTFPERQLVEIAKAFVTAELRQQRAGHPARRADQRAEPDARRRCCSRSSSDGGTGRRSSTCPTC